MSDPKQDRYSRPEGSSDQTVEAVGAVSEAFEWIEKARGQLYEFHQNMGHADGLFKEATEKLREAGHEKHAQILEEEVCGMNVIKGRWTFQVVDEFDEGYYDTAKSVHQTILDELMESKKHVFESEMKEQRRTKSKKGHESRP